jgi:type I restriction enzyme R subunit
LKPPFTNTHDQGLFGVFDDAGTGKVLNLIDGINQNALVRAVA